MVKFGRHLQFYLEDDKDQCNCDEPYIVQYTDIKELIGDSQEKFTKEWQNSLSVATQDYNKRVRLLWDTIFDGLFRQSERGDAEQANRGLPPKQAIWLYVSTLDEKLSRDLFCSMKKIHSSASINVEALRKLVKVCSISYTCISLICTSHVIHILLVIHIPSLYCNTHRNLIREQSIEEMTC